MTIRAIQTPKATLKDQRKRNPDVVGADPDTIVRHLREDKRIVRSYVIERDDSDGPAVDEEKRTVRVAFSSEDPYRRYWGYEVLGHKNEEIDLSRLGSGAAAVLVDHWSDQVGVVQSVTIDEKSGVGRAVLRFSKSDDGEKIFRDIVDEIRKNISVGYAVNDMILVEETDDVRTYRVTDWTPFEISVVSIPADHVQVGVGKSVESPETKTTINHIEVREMQTEENTVSEADIQARENTAADAAREEVKKHNAKLIAIGERFGAQELAMKAVSEGWSTEQLLEKMHEAKHATPNPASREADVDLTDNEVKHYSLARLIRAQAFGHNNPRFVKEAGLELEASQAIKTRNGDANTSVPAQIIQQLARSEAARRLSARAHSVGSAPDGGNLVDTILDGAGMEDLLRPRMVIPGLGARVYDGLEGDLAFPRKISGAAATHVAENGASSETSATFDQIAMTPHTAAAHTELSRRMLLQPILAADAMAMDELATTLALFIDLNLITADGTANAPVGILGTAGIGSIAVGGAINWDVPVDLETQVAIENADVEGMNYVTNPAIRGAMKKTKVDAGSGEFIWARNERVSPVNGYGVGISTHVPAGTVLFGDFTKLRIGYWSGLDMLVNPYSNDTTGAVRITAFQDYDCVVSQPKAFAAATGITTS